MTGQKFKSDIVEDLRKFDSFKKYLYELRDGILKDDRLALIIIYSAVEMILDFLLERLCKHGSLISKQRIPFIGKAILLSEIGLIDNELFNNLNVIKDLRNKVAHRPADNIIWQGKFAFDKNKPLYEAFVGYCGYEPRDLVDKLFFIWHNLDWEGKGIFAKRHLGKLKTQSQRTSKNNK